MDEDHYVDVFDENDVVTGKDLRTNKSRKGFITRIVGILIRDSEGKYIICKRSPHKKSEPNVFDFTACGAVNAGETYENAAQRELFEEVSMTCALRLLKKQYFEFHTNSGIRKSFIVIFEGVSDEQVILCDELCEYKKLSFRELLDEVKNHPEQFTVNFGRELASVSDELMNSK